MIGLSWVHLETSVPTCGLFHMAQAAFKESLLKQYQHQRISGNWVRFGDKVFLQKRTKISNLFWNLRHQKRLSLQVHVTKLILSLLAGLKLTKLLCLWVFVKRSRITIYFVSSLIYLPTTYHHADKMSHNHQTKGICLNWAFYHEINEWHPLWAD